MMRADAIVVGGGPAGSTCAWKLREAGIDVVILDRAAFPRAKLCAGWVTPEALSDLELEPADYPLSLMTFDRLHFHWKMITAKPGTRQYSIRRYEFDDFLLRRSGARVLQHKVREIRRDGGDYVVDGEIRGKYLVGAGGTSCPVYREVFHEDHPRSSSLQAATLELEFPYDWQDPACHLWFFDDGLPGYAWYVPTSSGYINIGLGGMADQLKLGERHLKEYWRLFVTKLRTLGLVTRDELNPKGYSYYLRGNVDAVRKDNAFLVGDAAGLATHDMCEGIGPAIKSGLLAARSIVTGAAYSLVGISRFTGAGPVSRILGRRFAGVRYR
jgi:flavin-dependent dehydrogenase